MGKRDTTMYFLLKPRYARNITSAVMLWLLLFAYGEGNLYKIIVLYRIECQRDRRDYYWSIRLSQLFERRLLVVMNYKTRNSERRSPAR